MKLYLPIALLFAALAIASPANNAGAADGAVADHHCRKGFHGCLNHCHKDKDRKRCENKCWRRFCDDRDGHDGHDGDDDHDGHDGHDGHDRHDGHDE